MSIARVAGKLRDQIHGFSGELSRGLCKKAADFVEEMVYGIQSRQSLRLSEIGRSLKQSTSLKKIVDRLSRNLDREGIGLQVAENVRRQGAGRIGDDTLLVLDISDIRKKYAKKMENLATVHDGSEGGCCEGYWTLGVIGIECGRQEITPMDWTLWSQKAKDFKSENDEVLKSIRRVREHTGSRGIWVIDRGADRRMILHPLLEMPGARFLIRMVGNRDIIYRASSRNMLAVARECPMLYRDRIVKEEKGREKVYDLEYGFRKVKLPERDEQLYLIVIKGIGHKPMMLLTNVEARHSRKNLWWFLQAYLTRWRIEDTIRYIKQSYALEDIRVLRYRRLQNMMGLVLAAAFFAASWLGAKAKLHILAHHILEAAQRIFGIPNFRYYALADGIHDILRQKGKPPDTQKNKELPSLQLDLFSG